MRAAEDSAYPGPAGCALAHAALGSPLQVRDVVWLAEGPPPERRLSECLLLLRANPGGYQLRIRLFAGKRRVAQLPIQRMRRDELVDAPARVMKVAAPA